MSGTGYDLAIEFPDQSPSFALGFEVGQLYGRMTSAQALGFSHHKITALINDEHVEFVAQIANRLGFLARFEEACGEGYANVILTKAQK